MTTKKEIESEIKKCTKNCFYYYRQSTQDTIRKIIEHIKTADEHNIQLSKTCCRTIISKCIGMQHNVSHYYNRQNSNVLLSTDFILNTSLLLRYYTPTKKIILKIFNKEEFAPFFTALKNKNVTYEFTPTQIATIMSNNIVPEDTIKYLLKIIFQQNNFTLNSQYLTHANKYCCNYIKEYITTNNITEFTNEHLNAICLNYDNAKDIMKIILDNDNGVGFNQTSLRNVIQKSPENIELIKRITDNIGINEETIMSLLTYQSNHIGYDNIPTTLLAFYAWCFDIIKNYTPLTKNILHSVCESHIIHSPGNIIQYFEKQNILFDNTCINVLAKHIDTHKKISQYLIKYKIIPTHDAIFCNTYSTTTNIPELISFGLPINKPTIDHCFLNNIGVIPLTYLDKDAKLHTIMLNKYNRKMFTNKLSLDDLSRINEMMCIETNANELVCYFRKLCPDFKFNKTCLRNIVLKRKCKAVSEKLAWWVVARLETFPIEKDIVEKLFKTFTTMSPKKIFKNDGLINVKLFNKHKPIMSWYSRLTLTKIIELFNDDTHLPVTPVTTLLATNLTPLTKPLTKPTTLRASLTIPPLYATYFNIAQTTKISFINLRYDFIKRLTKNKWNKNNQFTIPKTLSTHLTIPNNQTVINITDLDNLLYLFY